MKNFGAYMAKTLMAGLLVIAPVYLAILLLLKGHGLISGACWSYGESTP